MDSFTTCDFSFLPDSAPSFEEQIGSTRTMDMTISQDVLRDFEHNSQPAGGFYCVIA